jgi:hypothetical protein
MFCRMRDDLEPEPDTWRSDTTDGAAGDPTAEEPPPAGVELAASGSAPGLTEAERTPSRGCGARPGCQWPGAALQAAAPQAEPQAVLPALAIKGSRSCPSLRAQGGTPRSGAPLAYLADTPNLGRCALATSTGCQHWLPQSALAPRKGSTPCCPCLCPKPASEQSRSPVPIRPCRVPGTGSAPSLHATWGSVRGTEGGAPASPKGSGSDSCGDPGQQHQPGEPPRQARLPPAHWGRPPEPPPLRGAPSSSRQRAGCRPGGH